MTWDSAVAGGVVALIGKIVFDWLNGKKHNGNGAAGAKDVSFWELKYKEIGDRIIEAVTECIQESEGRLMKAIEARRRTRE